MTPCCFSVRFYLFKQAKKAQYMKSLCINRKQISNLGKIQWIKYDNDKNVSVMRLIYTCLHINYNSFPK